MVTLYLIGWSYVIGVSSYLPAHEYRLYQFTYIGVAVYFTMDVSDIFLAVS